MRQLEPADDPAERAARTTFVGVGAGYTGTDVVGQGELLNCDALRHFPRLSPDEARWVLLDLAPAPAGARPEAVRPAMRVLRRRGVDVRLQTTVTEVTPLCARLSDGTQSPTHTVVGCVGARPDPLVEAIGLATCQGRLAVDSRIA